MSNAIHRVITVLVDGMEPVIGELRVEHEVIQVDSRGPERDKRWTFVDDAAHFHAYSTDDKEPYPTLTARTEQVPCDGGCGDGGCEGYTLVHYHCLICDQRIEPGTIPGPHSSSIPGPVSWYVAIRTPGLLDLKDVVSVRVRTEPLNRADGGLEMFGVAQARAESMTSDGTRWMLTGVSPLGRRALTAAGAR